MLLVRQHIESIPALDSHYRRENTNKQYFEDCTLNITKIYQLYLDWIPPGTSPVKDWKYRQIFNHEYNYGFSPPKNDICDVCSLFKARQTAGDVTEEYELEFERHHHEKIAIKSDRDKDRLVSDSVVLCFDLENVFSMPQCGVSSFFYKQKLTGYNLTAHAMLRTNNVVTKRYYCAIWHEDQAGRGGNEIASALVVILKHAAIDFSGCNTFVTWSDSCVPQNRNQMMSFAIQNFLQSQSEIETIK